MNTSVVEKARELIGEVVIGYLATADKEAARVRPMGARWVGERELWFHTVTGTRKIADIETKPGVEICFRDTAWNHVRIAGRACVTRSPSDLKKLCETWPEILQRYTGPDDPRLTMIRLVIDRVAYSAAGKEGYEVHEFEAR